MSYKINSFAFQDGDNKVISYTYSILNDDGSIQRSNLRRSLFITPDMALILPVTNNVLDVTKSIEDFLLAHIAD